MSQRVEQARRAVVRSAGPWLAATALLLAACNEAPEEAPAPPPPAVSVVELSPQQVTPTDKFVGRVVAVDQVDLRARVQGFLEKRLFTEGQEVKKGDLLYVIEQPPFQAQVAEAKADVARSEASVAETEATLERVTEASSSGAVSKQEVDQASADDKRAKAEVLAAKAQLEIAELNLGYTEIQAPIEGRIGLTNYTIGNLVGPDSGVLATIVSQDPIYVTFPVSTRIILAVREEIVATGSSDEYVVRVQLPNGKIYGHPGDVNFSDIQVDQTTDTITVRAEFPNPNSFLVDGEFVNVMVERQTPEQQLVIPQSALQIDQAGSYVLAVGDQDEVEQKRIETGQTYGTNMAVTKGLEEGDRVIVEGIQKVRPGGKVDVTVLPPQETPSLAPSTTGSDDASGTSGSDDGAGGQTLEPAESTQSDSAQPAADDATASDDAATAGESDDASDGADSDTSPQGEASDQAGETTGSAPSDDAAAPAAQ